MSNLDNIYWKTYGWMQTKLNLKGIEKELFAIIYSYTENNKRCFLSINDLAYLTGASRRTVIYNLESLTDKELILKTERDSRQWESNIYDANIDKIENILNDLVQKLHYPSAKNAPFNIYNNKSSYNTKDTIKENNRVIQYSFSRKKSDYIHWLTCVRDNQIIAICKSITNDKAFANVMLDVIPYFETKKRLNGGECNIIGNDAMTKAIKSMYDFADENYLDIDDDMADMYEEMIDCFFTYKSVENGDTLSLTQFANENMLIGMYNNTIGQWCGTNPFS